MARDLILDAVVRKDSKALGTLATELDGTAAKVDKLDTRMQSAAKTSKELDARIVALRRSTADLGAEYLRTGDKTILGDLNKGRQQIRQLERIKAEMEAIAKIGTDSGGGGLFSGLAGIGGQLGKLGPYAIGAGIGIGALLAPAIGAAISGAVVGAVGTGGIIGGIFAASRDSRVKAAASDFSQHFQTQFFNGGAFVAPIVNSLHELDNAVTDMDLTGKFAEVAPYVEDVARGIADAGRNFSDGFGRALANSGPYLEVLANRLPDIGDAIGDLIADVSESEGALLAWNGTLKAVERIIRFTGSALVWLSDRFEDMVHFQAGAAGFLEDFAKWIPFLMPMQSMFADANDNAEDLLASTERMKAASAGARVGMIGLGTAAKDTADAIGILSSNLLDLRSKEMGAADAADNFQLHLLQLKDSVAQNGVELNTNTQAGLQNRIMLRGLVEEAQRVRQANIDANMPIEEANRIYQDQISQLQTLAVNLGFTRDAVATLVGVYRQIPPVITTEFIAKYSTVGQPWGEHSGVRYSETYGSNGQGGFQERAAGGTAFAGTLYKVNEQGTGNTVELFRPAVTGTVVPLTGSGAQQGASMGGSADPARLMAQAVAGAMAGLVVVLDGQAVGRIQARTAQRYQRGG